MRTIYQSAKWLLFVLAVFIAQAVYAVDKKYSAAALTGSQVAVGSTINVRDTLLFAGMPANSIGISSRSMINFQINEAYTGVMPDSFRVTFVFNVHFAYGVNNWGDEFGQVKTITYSKNNPYLHKALHSKVNWHAAEVTITNIIYEHGDPAQVQPALMVTNELMVDWQLPFTWEGSAVRNLYRSADSVALTGELKVWWPTEPYAEEYDLEWTYIDNEALPNYYLPNSTNYNVQKIFKQNASRVSLKQEQYFIPLLYEGGGTLFYRVRSVQIKIGGFRVESLWSTNYLPGGLGQYQFSGMDNKLNWQATTSYAEEGKRKSVVQYFDGSLKSRQTVTKDNTTLTTVVAETLYDHQGRPVIQVMPAPTLSNIIKYTPRFNRLGSLEYSKAIYDAEAEDSCYCKEGAPKMDSGAAKYYSPANPLAAGGFHKYIPNAEGFVFSETKYTPDNTGRISMQGGVGKDFRIGTGHETEYGYNKAGQEELDALFGTEVGWASHYFKNTVRDANGQLSISYVDMHGRTIATALAGDGSSRFEKLPSNQGYAVVRQLLDSQSNVIKGTSIESSKGLVVTKAGKHRFRYSLVNDSINIKDCNNTSICYDCIYDLKITIVDECNDTSYRPRKPIVITRTNYSLSTACDGPAILPMVDDSLFLEEGNYVVTKTLTINNQAFTYFRDSVFMKRNTCVKRDTLIAQTKRALLQGISCTPVSNEANNRLDISMRAQLLADVTPPSGQYANPNDIDPFSIFAGIGGGRERFNTIAGSFPNEDGSNFSIPPAQMTREQLLANFQSGWAEKLLVLHPEYPKLQRYTEFATSHAWDQQFDTTDTYQQAFAKGFLNPGNFSNRGVQEAVYNPTYSDPFFTDYVGTITTIEHKNAMNGSLVKEIPDWQPINLWSLSTIMSHCESGDLECLEHFSLPQNAFKVGAECSGELDMAWRYFRAMYQQEKRKIIDQDLQAYQRVNGKFTEEELLNHKHILNFGVPEMYKAENIPHEETDARDSLNVFLDANCRGYVEQWIRELAPCNYTQADYDSIIPKLINVCKQGGDTEHMFGASTVSPGSTYQYKSFEEVLKAHGKPYNSKCNAYLITAPLPYNKQPVYYDKPVWQKPDSCECATINSLYQQYQSTGIDANFAAYLNRKTGVQVRQGTLDTLRMSCNGQIDCRFLKSPIVLPPVLQCGGQDVCVDCITMNAAYQNFLKEFPDAAPSLDNPDSVQLERNKLFVQYMNLKLGFAKEISEYLAFLDTCGLEDLNYCNKALGYSKPKKQFVRINKQNQRLDLGAGQFTLEAIVKPSSSGNMELLSNRTFANNTAANGLSWLIDASGNLIFQAQGCYNYLSNSTSNFNLFDGKAHHLAVTRDGDSLRFYVDGQNYPWTLTCLNPVNTTPLSQRNVTTAGPFFIGRDSADLNAAYNGWISEVRIWNVARTQAEVNQYKNDMLSPQEGLVGYYVLRSSDTCEQVITDRSTNNPALKNNAVLGSSTAKESTDPVWLSGAQIAFDAQDPPGAINTCGSCNTFSSISDSLLFRTVSDYKKYGGTPHFDASGVDTTHIKVDHGGAQYTLPIPFAQMVENGVLRLPAPYADTANKAAFALDHVLDTVCLDSAGFTFETRIKLPDSLIVPNSYRDSWWFEFKNTAPSGNFLAVLSPHDGEGAAFCADWNGPNGYCADLNVPGQHLNDWATVKLQFRGRQFKMFVNDVLLGGHTLKGPMTNLHLWTLTSYSLKGSVDYVRMYDTAGVMIYNEEFNDPYNLAIIHENHRCSPCNGRFVQYFNQRHGTQFTALQVAGLYRARNISYYPCGESPTLCGRTKAVFAPVTLPVYTPCTDSTMLAVSTGTLLYEYYSDSLKGSFSDRYLARCLNARYNETFTVASDISEYHYTLYYYDQAGNLLKTIPPTGVDVSKFTHLRSWSDSVTLARKRNQKLPLKHTLPTNYRYNTLNQVVASHSPDGGLAEFWYDRLGRLAISRNARQLANSATEANRLYSYTKYDTLGRIFEVGQVSNTVVNGTVTDALTRNNGSLRAWLTALNNRRSQITNTVYDEAYTGFGSIEPAMVVSPKNLRNRVSYTTYTDTGTLNVYNQATFYSYDILGNVDTLLQDYGRTDVTGVQNVMNMNGNRFKKIIYYYDLVSGKVNQVHYQRNWTDQWLHRYTYDAENRLILAETSSDSVNWEREARYEYYLHGPLARMTLGGQMVQGVDYAYTLQGWLKGINSTGGSRVHDIGRDGDTSYANRYTAVDAMGLTLNYFAGDYTPAAPGVTPFPGYSGLLNSNYRPLYNGNISSMSVYQKRFKDGAIPGGPLIFYNYKYDQLNRLVGQDAYNGFDSTNNSWGTLPSMGEKLKERIMYDANGNILRYLRKGIEGTSADMDSLTYNYYAGTNQLNYIRDTVNDNVYPTQSYLVADLDSQSINNYKYDAIGNLIKDNKEGITEIKWNVYGKIQEITRTATTALPAASIRYTYDASGNRISQVVTQNDGKKLYTWYVRDAQGNIMTTYTAEGSASNLIDLNLQYEDRFIYGSSRLGTYSGKVSMDNGPVYNEGYRYEGGFFYRGYKQYELTNHLGNVLSVISDKKFGVTSGGSSLIDHFEPEIVSATDYYPFGMPSRVASGKYRFGFGGQEMNNSIKGYGNSYTAQFWEYDARVGRRWNLDPVIKTPESPYASFHNSPILFNDPFGDDPPKKPSLWTRFWRASNAESYKTRAEVFANEHNIDEDNIVKLDNSWVVVNDKDPKDARFSVFRQARANPTLKTTFDSPDDLNLSTDQLLKTNVEGSPVIVLTLPAAASTQGVVTMGIKSRSVIVGILNQTAKTLQAYGKQIRFGVTGHPDVLKKGVHLHFDEIVPKLELALRPMQGGKVGLVQVGKLVGTADDVKKAVNLFSQAMNNAKFRSEMIVRLKSAQEYLQRSFQFTKDSQLAIDKAHEINYLIKSLQKL